MNNLLNNERSVLVDSIIIYFFFFTVILLESLKTLTGLFTYGIFKKEVLTTKSKLGFDFKIKIK